MQPCRKLTSLKDFFDATLARETEHLDDLLVSACCFEQIVNIWSLARSERGEHLEERIKRAPEKLLTAIRQNIRRPDDARINFGQSASRLRRLDVRAEARLCTMLSVADRTKSPVALETVASYAQGLLQSWLSRGGPDFRAGVAILRAIDASEWARIGELNLHARFRTAMLTALDEAWIGYDIAAVAAYATGVDVQWTTQDQTVLVAIAERYLDSGFLEELADCSRTDELQQLSENIEAICLCCNLDAQAFHDDINERLGEVAGPDDDDERPTRRWEGEPQPTLEAMQEAEVKRIFDGLR